MKQAELTTVASKYDYNETIDRFTAALVKRNMSIFARIDHAALARSVDITLRPTEVFFIGNPRAGAPLMQEVQTIGIDLPLKVLIWKDEAQKVFLSYNDPNLIAERNGLGPANRQIAAAVSKALVEVAREVTGEEAAA
jgi:uncharacterized protein (DUF302 family)